LNVLIYAEKIMHDTSRSFFNFIFVIFGDLLVKVMNRSNNVRILLRVNYALNLLNVVFNLILFHLIYIIYII